MEKAPVLAVRGRHLPALDGVRAFAILGVLAYHLGFGWASGGYLGVDLFFVLSGFLITSLLVEERLSNGRVSLGSFWVRRAKRLLPGLLLMLVALGAFLALAGASGLADLGQIRADAIATVLYVANWHLLFAHQSYFASYASPSPLAHTWSLGIEEQFYVLWPPVVVCLLALAKGSWRPFGVGLAAGGAALSAAWMAYLSLGGASANRLYYGTDTRAFDLLIGATLAFLLAARPQLGEQSRLLDLAGPLAALGLGLFWWRAGGSSGQPSRSMFEWGFFLCALLAGVVLADVRRPGGSPLGRLLSLPPLVFLGTISYELYLWHWPVIVELDHSRLGLSGLPLAAAQVAIALGLATASYYAFDRPIRRARLAGWPAAVRALLVPAGMLTAALVMVAGTLPVSGAVDLSTVSYGEASGASSTVIGRPIGLSPPPSKKHKLRVALIGDSVMRADGPAVVAALQSTGEVEVDDLGYPGWGLTTDKNWRTGVPAQLRADRAQLVICMWSFDDTFLAAHPRTYHRWMDQFVRLLLAQPSVEGVVFQQFPVLGPLLNVPAREEKAVVATRNRENDAWNRLVSRLPAAFPGKVIYLPIGAALTRRGHFSFWLPPGDRWSLPKSRWERVRSRDGVHLCPPGAARYAAALVFDLRRLYHLAPTSSSWATGPWTKDARYNEPAGNCPDDHPS